MNTNQSRVERGTVCFVAVMRFGQSLTRPHWADCEFPGKLGSALCDISSLSCCGIMQRRGGDGSCSVLSRRLVSIGLARRKSGRHRVRSVVALVRIMEMRNDAKVARPWLLRCHMKGVWFPLGLTQWDQQLRATSRIQRKKALLPACPDGSNDSFARWPAPGSISVLTCTVPRVSCTAASSKAARCIGTGSKT